MDQKIEVQNQSKRKKLSIFFNQATLEDQRAIQEIDDAQEGKSNSKCLFEIRNCQPLKIHQGDQDISFSSVQVCLNDFLQESQKDINATNQSLCKSPKEEKIQISFNHYLNQNQKISQSQPKIQQAQEQDIKRNLHKNGNDEIQVHYEKIAQEGERKSNTIDGINQHFNEQVQSNYFLSKNTIIKSETQNKVSLDDCQLKRINQSTRQKINSHILIQDDIFYEKDFKKLGTKVNYALKSQYQLQQELISSSAYKQNLQKAAKIVSRLLNSSMNRVMRIRQYVNNFIALLRLRHQNRRIQSLSRQEFVAINDLSYFHQQKGKSHQSYAIFRILLYILKFAKYFPTFMPSNTLRVIWDVIQVAIIYFFLYVYSLLIFFDSNSFDPEFMNKFNLAAFTLFLVDILVSLNTSFYDKDIIITKRVLIVRKYFFSSVFVTDFLSMFMLGSKIMYSNQLIQYDLNQNVSIFGLNLLIFLKANGVSSKKKRFDYIFTLNESQKHICKLINQLSTVLTVAHLAAIGWYFVGKQEANKNQINWLDKVGIQSISLHEQYIYAIYWSITTMTTGFILQEIEKCSKQLNDDLSTIQRKNLKQNQEIVQRLKQNLQTQIGESLFLLEENFSSSCDSMAQYENDEEDEDSQSQIPNNSEDKDSNQMKSLKTQEKEKIDKSSKSMLKTEKSYQTTQDEIECQNNQENQSPKCHSNLVYENQDARKSIMNNFNSQARLKSLDVTDCIDSNYQDSFISVFNRQKSQQESNIVYYKKDTDSFQSKKPEQLQSEKEGSNLNISKTFDKQKSYQQNTICSNNQQADQQINQIRRCSNHSQLTKQMAQLISSQLQEDQVLTTPNHENCQIQQNSRSESNKKQSFSNNPQSHSHKNSFQKSQKILNQNQREKRCSLDQSIQNITAFMLLQNKNTTSSQYINNANYYNQDNSAKNFGSNLSIKDRKESSSPHQKNKRLSYNKNSFKESSQNKLQTQQPNELSRKEITNNDLQLIERLSKILQNSQIPLLLQLTTGRSFQNLDSQFLSNPMDYFDKMQCFKKFYPDYNFDKILQKLKNSQQEQKRQKKVKLASRERRQNIGLTKVSLFQANSNVLKLLPLDYDINQYKPTYLSYGTKIKKGIVYPINNLYLPNR
ncbi:hypothetical protein ABPG74_020104 [Tetrahymena malaccensis]